MFRPAMRSVPPPPGAGLTKLADPRRVLMGWVLFLVAVAVVLALAWPYGAGAAVDRLRRDVAASGYLRQAQQAARDVPVRRDEALAALDRAVELSPQDPLIVDAAAQLYVELRAYAQAAKWLKALPADMAPADGETSELESLLTRVTYAQSLIMTGRVQEGARLLEQVSTESHAARERGLMPDPLFALVLNNIAYVNALGKRELPTALEMATLAVKLQPTQSAYLDTLGWVEFELGSYRNAAFHLERAVRLHLPEENAEMYYHLGAAYARLSRRDDARWNLARALELDPSYVEAADELRLLSQDLPQPSLI